MTELMVELKEQRSKLDRLEKSLNHSKPIWTINELCAFTHLSKGHIYNLTSTGQIPFYRRSKHLFFDREEIIAWLKENRGYNLEEIADSAQDAILQRGDRK